MISILLRLAVIALLVYAGVALWYGRVEDRLQRQEPVKQEERVANSGARREAACAGRKRLPDYFNQEYFQGGS